MLFKCLTPNQEAAALTAGLLSVLTLGCLSLIALVGAAIWLLLQVLFLALTSVLEAANTVGALYASSDPLVKFLILCALGYTLFRIVKTHDWRIVR